MIVSFKFFVMNFVDFVIDFYSHITSHVSYVFASRTHYTGYSLLNIVHVIVCVYGLTNQVFLQSLWIMCKLNLLLENLWRMQNFVFGNIGLKNSCLENHIISYSCIFVLKFQSFELNQLVFQKLCFPEKFGEPLPDSIGPMCFFDRSKFLKV